MEEIKATTEKPKKKETDRYSTYPSTNVGKNHFVSERICKKKKIDNAVLEMIVSDLQPLSIVEDAGFKKTIGNSRQQVPTSESISDNKITRALHRHEKLNYKSNSILQIFGPLCKQSHIVVSRLIISPVIGN